MQPQDDAHTAAPVRRSRKRLALLAAAAVVAVAVPFAQAGTGGGQAPGTGAGQPRPSAASHGSGAPRVSADLTEPRTLDIAMRLVSSAEHSSLDWRAQYASIEDIGDGRGYTAGTIGFCSGTGDMLDLVEEYTRHRPANPLAPYLPALRRVNGTGSHRGLDPGFPGAWRAAAGDPLFQRAQDDERDRQYVRPAVRQAKRDGLRLLGQFAYFDALVMHGAGGGQTSFSAMRQSAVHRARPPSQGGDETAYLRAFLDARVRAMRREKAHHDTSRVDTAQRLFLDAGNLDLDPPLEWRVYGDTYRISR